MSVRFRIRTSAGQELSFATLEVFEDFVRSGDLSPDDLVYDAEDGSWSPARTHPLVLDIEYQKEDESASDDADAPEPPAEAVPERDSGESDKSFGLSLAPEQPGEDGEGDAEGTGEGEDAEATSDPSLDGDAAPDSDAAPESEAAPEAETDPDQSASESSAFGLELAPEPVISDEEATRAFVERMEAEREASLDFGSRSNVQGFSMDDSSTLADMLSPAPPPPEPPPAATPPRPRPKAPRAREPRPDPKPRTDTKARTAKSGGGGGFARLLFVIVGLGVVGGAGYFGYQAFATGETPEPDPAVPVEPLPVEPEPEPTPVPVIAQTEAAIRERAQERFLTATQNALRDLGR